MKQETTESKSFLANTKKELSVFEKMFRRQPLRLADSNSTERSGLQRVLTARDLIGFGIAITVGSGIFVISGIAGKHAGPGLFLSFIIGGVCCLFSGLCYCEFSTRIPVAGSAYTYAYCSFGEIVRFVNWMYICCNNCSRIIIIYENIFTRYWHIKTIFIWHYVWI